MTLPVLEAYQRHVAARRKPDGMPLSRSTLEKAIVPLRGFSADESERPGVMLLSVVVLEPGEVDPARRALLRVGARITVPHAAVDRLVGGDAGPPEPPAPDVQQDHCPTCGSRLSARTRPTCSAARRSSS